MYYACNIILKVGFGDIVPSEISGKLLVIASVFAGFVLLIYCYVDMISLCLLTEQMPHRYRNNMISLMHYLKKRNVPDPLLKRVKNFLILRWIYDKGIGKSCHFFI